MDVIIPQPVHALPPPQLCPVVHRDHSRLWNEYIHRYHYLGHKPLPGAQLRYFVTLDQQIVAALGFGAAIFRTIGYTAISPPVRKMAGKPHPIFLQSSPGR